MQRQIRQHWWWLRVSLVNRTIISGSGLDRRQSGRDPKCWGCCIIGGVFCKKNSSNCSFMYVFLLFWHKIQSIFFSFFLHHSAYTSFLCTVLEVMQKAAADLADTPFSLLLAPHGCTTALLKQQLRWCTSSGGGAAHFQRPLRPLSATTDRFDQYFVQKSTCCVLKHYY